MCRGKIKSLIEVKKEELEKLMRHEEVIVDMTTDEGNTKKRLYLSSQLPDIHEELTEDKHIGLEELLWKLRDTSKTKPNPD
jgi:hypothetical protein